MIATTAVSAAILFLSTHSPATEAIHMAVAKALPLLEKGAEGHVDQKTCFACHNQAFPMAAFALAKGRGFALAEKRIEGQAEHLVEFITQNEKAYRTGKGTGGQVDTAGWLLFTLERAGHKPDAATAAVVEYLLQKDAERTHWTASSNRPPTEASLFTANYLAVHGLKVWGKAEQQEAIAKRIAATREWALKTPAKDTEDRVYRLRLLKESDAPEKAVRAAAKELRASQRIDGGWAQLDSLGSDAYATGSVLVTLHETSFLATDAPAYRRGLAFLVRTQLADGSWYVLSRSKPFQPYYETGFPHKKDQFISVSASAWATAALALACPEK